jgi:CheY-like chemotaxis protein
MALKKLNNKLNILIVDDDLLSQMFLKIVIENMGLSCDTVNSGKLAIEKIKTIQYDLILMDRQMPQMSGLETIQYLRNEMYCNTPIVVITADEIDLTKDAYINLKINDWIKKPIDEKILHQKLVKLTDLKSLDYLPHRIPTLNNQNNACINLEYLVARTNNNPILISEIIMAFLKQTPELIFAIKKNSADKIWIIVLKALHKLIPSFKILGMNKLFFELLNKIQTKAIAQNYNIGLTQLITALEKECDKAYIELNTTLIQLNKH